jgi:HK97 family phage prohead protease
VTVVVGVAVDHLGLASQWRAVRAGRYAGANFEMRRRFSELPAADIAQAQPADILVDVDHRGRAVGEVQHLERDGRGSLWAVARIDDPDVDLDRHRHFSVDVRHDRAGGQWTIGGIAVTDRPAMSCIGELRVLDDVRDVRELDQTQILRLEPTEPHLAGLLARAAAAARERRCGDPIVVAGSTAAAGAPAAPLEQPAGPIEHRTAQRLEVKSGRTIEVVVMPYERETVVAHKGRMIREICSRGAFDEVDRQSNRIHVNRDHNVERLVGRAERFHPHRSEGLVAELRIARTELGDETLALAADGCLDASAGFAVMPHGERWEQRDRRRLTRAWLDHVALTPDPAYQDARVLGVRSAPSR